MKARRWVLAFSIFLAVVFAHAQAGASFYSGKMLVELMQEYEKAGTGMKSPEVDRETMRAYAAYVAGVYDALSDVIWSRSDKVSLGHICEIVSRYLKNHPEKWGESASDLVIQALMEAFP